MRHLFTPKGLRELGAFVGPRTLLVFDFDGTLAPIVRDPAAAVLSKASAKLLTELTATRPVAVLSGRARADVKIRTPFPLCAWIGNHGLEGVPGGRRETAAAARVVRGWEKELREALRALPGTFLESKRYSLTIHYRLSAQAALTRRQALQIAVGLDPAPRIVAGKCVLNLLPPGHANKGEALRRILAGGRWENALFVGDDETDEDVFRLRDPRVFSVRVGRGRRSAADWYVPTQREVARLLRLLLAGKT